MNARIEKKLKDKIYSLRRSIKDFERRVEEIQQYLEYEKFELNNCMKTYEENFGVFNDL